MRAWIFALMLAACSTPERRQPPPPQTQTQAMRAKYPDKLLAPNQRRALEIDRGVPVDPAR